MGVTTIVGGCGCCGVDHCAEMRTWSVPPCSGVIPPRTLYATVTAFPGVCSCFSIGTSYKLECTRIAFGSIAAGTISYYQLYLNAYVGHLPTGCLISCGFPITGERVLLIRLVENSGTLRLILWVVWRTPNPDPTTNVDYPYIYDSAGLPCSGASPEGTRNIVSCSPFLADYTNFTNTSLLANINCDSSDMSLLKFVVSE